MSNSHSELWCQCLKHIRQNVSKQIYETWFEPIVFLGYNAESKTVLVQVPSMFFYEYLEQNYVRLMAWALKTTFKTNVSLTYRLLTDKDNHLTQDVQGDNAEDIEVAAPKETRINKSPSVLDAAVPQRLNSQLDAHLTFDSFIEGDSNKLPRTVGLSIANHPGRSTFNPFFVFGPSGCGKTHLINAIGVQAKKTYPDRRILYVSARLFQIQYTDAVLQNTTNDFISFYQSLDMLIVDDIQEWVSSPRTLDTFFHVFDHLFRLGKQIILASDRPPVALSGVKDRLLTRFSCGLIAELEKPNPQLCKDILCAKCRRDGLVISEEVIDYVAQTANGSVRDLVGVVNSLMAYSIVYNSNIDLQLAERIIKRSVKIDNRPLTVDDILEKVCQHYGVTQQNVFSKSRKREYVQARQVSMYLSQKHTKMPNARIGKLIGGRDHSTVIHSCNAVEQRLNTDKSFAAEIHEIEASFSLKQ